MTKRDFRRVEQDLEQAVSKLKATEDPTLRRALLLKMRTLLVEADRLLVEMSCLSGPVKELGK
jgi:hypothetical protein